MADERDADLEFDCSAHHECTCSNSAYEANEFSSSKDYTLGVRTIRYKHSEGSNCISISSKGKN